MPDGCVEYGQDILLTWDLPIFVKMLNPNKVRLFEGSFSGVGGGGGGGGGGGWEGGSIWPTPSYFKKN